MQIYYAPIFLRQLKALEKDLQAEVIERIQLFKDRRNHKQLKVHKLKGRLVGRLSFSVDYKNRVVFRYLNTKTAVLLAVGDHDVYR